MDILLLYIKKREEVPMEKQITNPLEVATNAIESLGWEVDLDEEVLFQEGVYFTTPGKSVDYYANLVQHTAGILHLELAVALHNVSEIKHLEYYMQRKFKRF